jgi:deoxyribodipyrimidine photolyase-related protein
VPPTDLAAPYAKTLPLPASEPTPLPPSARRTTVVLPWDLDPGLASFPRTPRDGALLVLETRAKPRALPFHRQKLTLVLSALRHFVEERRAAGFHVEHRVAGDYATGVSQFAAWAKPAELHATEPREWALHRRFQALATQWPLTLHPDGGAGGHFLLSRGDFQAWLEAQPDPEHPRMDRFYTFMRRRLGLLVDGRGQPEGGQWSFDADNRQHARGVEVPRIPWFTPDATTARVMRWVEREGTWGRLEGFGWPVTRAQARSWLDDFVRRRLEGFGPYEDALRGDARFLFHSLLSAPLNLGLLRPDEVVEAVVGAWRAGRAPLASVEGFVRQVIGWREFMRGVYWRWMPGLRHANLLGAQLPLPDFFWWPERASMQCMRDALESVEQTGYAHHIQRLMVLCNYATLAGLRPHAVSLWFWSAFVDAYEWVELPNVVGMGMSGTDAFTTKPYVASAAYIKRQSGAPAKGRGRPGESACATCRYDPDQRSGPDACPYNALYWDFMHRHRERLARNPRMATLLRTLDRWSPEERRAIHATADAHRAGLRAGAPPSAFDEDAG